MTTIEEQLSTLLSEPSGVSSDSSLFADGVGRIAARRHRARRIGFRASGALFAVVLGWGAWVNRPAPSRVSSTASGRIEPASGADAITLTDLQNGHSSLTGLARVVLADAWFELGTAVVVGVLIALVLRAWMAKRHVRSAWWEPALRVLIGLVALVVGWMAAFDVYWLPTDDMEPAFEQGGRVIVDPDRRDPAIGDVVIIDGVTDQQAGALGRTSGDSRIRRVLGLGGDTVRLADGVFTINGTTVDGLATVWEASTVEGLVELDSEVPEGWVLVASDQAWREGAISAHRIDDLRGIVRWRTTSTDPD